MQVGKFRVLPAARLGSHAADKPTRNKNENAEAKG